MERAITLLVTASILAVSVPAAAQLPTGVEALRNPSLEGPTEPGAATVNAGDATGFEFLYGNGETSSTARTGLQSANLGPAEAETMPWGALATLRAIPVNPHGATVPTPDGSASATVGAIPFDTVDSFSLHYNVPNELDEAGANLQMYFYLHEEGAVNTFGPSPVTEPFDPADYACPIVSDNVDLEQTDGWATVEVDGSTPVRAAGGFCGSGPTQPLADYQEANPDAQLLYAYAQTITSVDTWPDEQPILVDDLSLQVTPGALAG